jgi:hypothetical protein
LIAGFGQAIGLQTAIWMDRPASTCLIDSPVLEPFLEACETYAEMEFSKY